MIEKEYKTLYNSLLEAEELPEHFTGDWIEDKKEFILLQKELDTLINNKEIDLDEDECSNWE